MPGLSKIPENLVFSMSQGVQMSASGRHIRVLIVKHARFFSGEAIVMGKGDNRQKNDKKNKKVKKDAKKPGIPAAVKKA